MVGRGSRGDLQNLAATRVRSEDDAAPVGRIVSEDFVAFDEKVRGLEPPGRGEKAVRHGFGKVREALETLAVRRGTARGFEPRKGRAAKIRARRPVKEKDGCEDRQEGRASEEAVHGEKKADPHDRGAFGAARPVLGVPGHESAPESAWRSLRTRRTGRRMSIPQQSFVCMRLIRTLSSTMSKCETLSSG